MSCVPVILFTYNRPETTLAVLSSLMKNPEAKDTDLYIFSDAAKSEKQTAKVEEVRKVIESVDRSAFHEVFVTRQEVNQGLAKSIIGGVSTVMLNHDSVIVLEDDCVVSPRYLHYMNEALERYKDDPQIGSISGFTPALSVEPEGDVFAVMRSCSLGWGTWKRIWQTVDFDMKNYPQLRKDRAFIKKMNKCGSDRMYRLIRQVRYHLQSWSIRFGASLTERELLTVYPKYSYIENIGLESGGVHSGTDTPEAMKVKSDKGLAETEFPDSITEDLQISREFRRIYGGNRLNQLKRYLYIYGGERIIDAVRKK